MFRRLLQNKIVSNAGWLIFGKIIQMAISLIVGILTARYLGPSNYGLINYASAYTAFFTSLCTLGINSVIVKELVSHPQEDGQILGTSIGLRLVSSILSVITIIGISCILDANEPATILVVALYSVGSIVHVFDIFHYWFQAKLQSKTTAIASLIAYVLTAVYKIILLATGQPVFYFALVTSVDYLILALILFFEYRKDGGHKLSFCWPYGKELLKKSYHFILPGLMVAVYGQTDKLMLKQLLNEAEVGYYSTATTLCTMWCFVLSAIIDSLNPSIMQAYDTDRLEFRRLNRLSYCIVFYLSIFVSLVFTVFAPLAISLLYGSAYLPAVVPLRIVTWYTAFSYLGVARNAWVVCMNRQRCLKYIYLSSAVANVFLNLLLIPSMGAAGAALASLAAQIATTMVVPFFLKDMRENSILMIEAILFRNLRKK